jgi:hypothetical protein
MSHRFAALVLLALTSACGTEITAPDDGRSDDETSGEQDALVLDTAGIGDGDSSGNDANDDDTGNDDTVGDDADAVGDDASDDADALGDDDGSVGDEATDDDGTIEDDPPGPDPDEDDDPPPDEDPLPDGGLQSCSTWEECGPYPGDLNSGFECQENQCVCDPVGQWSATCAGAGGYFSDGDCLCVFGSTPPGDPNDGCYWHWHEDPCDPDQWVDTSYYDEVCTYDADGNQDCYWDYVEDGYYEDGACPTPYWEERC